MEGGWCVVLSLQLAGELVGIDIAHRPLLTSTSSHGNIDPKQDSTFFYFFFKVQKALCYPRERIFGQAVLCKGKEGS